MKTTANAEWPRFGGVLFYWISSRGTSPVAMVLIWFGASLYGLMLSNSAPVAVHYAITIALYPLVTEKFGRLQRRHLRRRHGPG